MASAVSPPEEPKTQNAEQHPRERETLRTSRFDVVTSFFMALILFIGTFVVMLFIVWALSGDETPPVINVPIEEPFGRGDNPEGFERDFEPPGSEEVEELIEPTLQDSIEAVTEAVSNVAASLETMDTNATATTEGTGKGDSRPAGPPGEGPGVVPRHERWQLNFSANSLDSYARQLDFYEIELAAVGGGIQGVDYASDLATNPRSRHVDDSSSENRLYFMWTSPSPLQQYDMQLLQQAGVPLKGRSQIRFVTPELEQQLYMAEMAYARENGISHPKEIAKTIFESKADGGGYVFEVVDQRYRKPG